MSCSQGTVVAWVSVVDMDPFELEYQSVLDLGRPFVARNESHETRNGNILLSTGKKRQVV